MRIALLVLASGFALSLSAPSYADEFVPDAQRFSAPYPAAAKQAGTDNVCRHMVHEGMLTPIVNCVSARTWERTRLETQKSIMDFQHHSYVVPLH